MSETLRNSIRALAVAIEATSGTDQFGAGPPATNTFVECDFELTLPADLVPNPVVNGAMEEASPVVGGIRPALTIRVPLRGTAAAGTAPEWSPLMRACSYAETLTASAIGVPTAIASGTTTALTLTAPFAGTAQLYRGMPLLLSGTAMNQGATLIQDYTAGRVATLIETLAIAPTVAQLAQIPPNVLYTPTSDESVFRTVTIWVYHDGMRHRFRGMSGTWSLEIQAGQMGFLVFEMQGILTEAFAAATVPAGWNATRPTPPLWLGGKSQLGRAVARTDRLRYQAGVGLAPIENPEAPQGFDAPVPISRAGSLEVTPFATTTLSPTRFGNFQQGVLMPFGAVIGAGAGNRAGFLLPQGKVTRFDVSARNSLGVDGVTMVPDGADLSASLCIF